MPTDSASALKKTNQELKAQINVPFGEIENLKLQLGVNANDVSTAAAIAATITTAAAAELTNLPQTSTATSSLFKLVQSQSSSG